jgi:hypothetical protein
MDFQTAGSAMMRPCFINSSKFQQQKEEDRHWKSVCIELIDSGILGRLEPNKDAKLCRLTIRSTNENVSKEFLHLLSQPLNADVAAS